MEIQGRIKQIFPSQMIGQNGFEKRDLVIVTEEQYPQTIIIQFTQQRLHLLHKEHHSRYNNRSCLITMGESRTLRY